jgi:HK97 family phage portal protein
LKSPWLWLKQFVAGFSNEETQFYRKYPKIYGMLGGGAPTWSGESVSGQTALYNSIVWACRRIICEAVGGVPLNMMQQNSNGEKRFAIEKPMYSALRDNPNPEMTAMMLRETVTGHAVMGGVGYAQIIRRSGTNVAYQLWPLLPEQVTQDREKTGQRRLVFVVKEGNAAEKTYTVEEGKPHDILHIPALSHDGVTGENVIAYARQSIGNAQAVEKYAGRFFGSGGRQPGHLEAAQKFTSLENMQKARADIDKWTDNPANIHRWPIFEPGLTFKPAAFSPQDSQFNETRQGIPAEICRWFGVAPHMVGDLLRGTFSNIEHQDLEFVKRTLTAWVTRWEKNLHRCVLTPDEQERGFFFHHNLNALVRGDFATRTAGYATALQNGWMSQNEVRSLENLNPFEGGDDYHVQLNMQTLPGGTPTTSERAALAKLGSSKKGAYLQ